MSHRLNISSEIDLRVTVLSGSGNENFNNYSELIVSVKKGTSSIYRRVLLNNYDKRVDVDFDDVSIDFFEDNTDYTILVKLVGINGNNDINLVNTFPYKDRPLSDFVVNITSSSNYENLQVIPEAPTPNMTIELNQAGVNATTLFNNVINVNLIIENANMLETLQIPVKDLITKTPPIRIYLNKLASDGSYNKLVLETSGNAYDSNVLNTNNVIIKDISENLITDFGEIIHTYITLETEYGTTDAKYKNHLLSRTPNTPDIGELFTNMTHYNIDKHNLFLEFDLKPNSVDLNDQVPKLSQIAAYNLEVIGNNMTYSLDVSCEQDAYGNRVNELKVRIDASGELTTTIIDTGVVNISGQFIDQLSNELNLVPLEHYTIKVKAYSNMEEGYSGFAQTTSYVLEKQPTVEVSVGESDNFFNNNVENYTMNFNYDVTKTIEAGIKITPKLKFAYLDGGGPGHTTESEQYILPKVSYMATTSGEHNNSFNFDISGAGNNALLAYKILITTEFEFNYNDVSAETITQDNSGNTLFKTLEVVYSDLSFIEFTLKSRDGQPDGFQLTLQPHTEIVEFRDEANTYQKNIYDGLDVTNKNKITTNLSSVDISYNGQIQKIFDNEDDHNAQYVFDVSKQFLGKNIQYEATLTNDITGLAHSSYREETIQLRVNDVSMISYEYNDITSNFTISNKRGYTLDIAVLSIVDPDNEKLEILADGADDGVGFDLSLNGIGVSDPTLTYNYPNMQNGTQLLVSLADKGEGANGKKEVFVLQA